ncbi:MAG TPA: DUF1460 domain-containing protein [Cyanobacteria bacterium UBA9273]|nr:DUF1460 domain-containing protein [Cyanobacteria bacterium UBA9273]
MELKGLIFTSQITIALAGLAIASAVALNFSSSEEVNQPMPQHPPLTNNSPKPTPSPHPSVTKSAATEEKERFQQIVNKAIAQQLPQQPMADIMQSIASSFLGTPYQANLLDRSDPETLVVTLKAFDCVLFIETVLAIARGIAVQDYSYDTFSDRLREQRYENGQINGYCSRLHYFSAWINENQERGTVANITGDLGGISLVKPLNFMTQHRQNYPQLATNEANYQCMVNIEAHLKDLTINYIPTNQIHHTYPQLQPGDIIGVATNIPGLDVTHTGLAYRQPDGTIGLIHASPAGSVRIARDLQQHVKKVDRAIGIIVARPLPPVTNN